MKKSFLAICSGVLFFAGCKEVPPVINFTNANYIDTTYLTVVPASTDLHNVFAEEFTGQSCSNCPQGHAVLDSAEVHNPGRVNVVALYENDNSSVTSPLAKSAYDFRSNTALLIGNSAIYNSVPSLPNGGIDRVPYSGSTGNLIGYPNWQGDITARLSIPDSLNMTVSSSYNTSSGIATITVTVIYTQTVLSPQNMSVFVVHDSIIDWQEEPFGLADSTYMFNDVFVGMVSAVPFGDPVLSSMTSKAPGRFLRRVYTYKVPTSFAKGLVNPAHCRVVACINAPGTSGSYEVYQSAQGKLMGP